MTRLPAACVVLVLAAGCSGQAGSSATEGPAAGGSEAGQRPSVGLSFTQLPSQLGENEGLLRVVNTGETELDVTGVGLDWAGYGGEFVQAEDTTLRPGQTLDFPVELPDPTCAEASGRPHGLIVSGERRTDRVLPPSSRGLLRLVHQRACDEQLVGERVDIAYGDSWRSSGRGGDSHIQGDLTMTRRAGDDLVAPVAVRGSVLYELELPGAKALPPGVSTGRFTLRILPGNRCDEHARSQVTAPFAFRLTLRIGSSDATVAIPPPPDVQARITELVERACG